MITVTTETKVLIFYIFIRNQITGVSQGRSNKRFLVVKNISP